MWGVEQKIPYLQKMIIFKEKTPKFFLFNAKTGERIILEAIGAQMMKLACMKLSLAQISQSIAQKYHINPALALNETIKFFRMLEFRGFITYDESRRAEVHPEEMSPPLELVTLRITNKCNLRCRHCFVSAGEGWENELNTDEIKNLIEEFAKFRILTLVLTGGEPLLREDFFEIAAYAESKNVPIQLSTNGTLIDDNVIENLQQMTNLQAVVLSLDGGSSSTHDYIRGHGNFDMTIALIKKLVQAGIPVHINTCLNRVNFAEYKKIIKISMDLGVKVIQLAPVFIEGRARDNEAELALTDEQKLEVARYCMLQRLNGKRILFGQIENDGLLIPDEKEPPLRKVLNCGASVGWCMIYPNGDVAPCRSIYDLGISAGNIREKSFSEIWQNSDLFNLLRSITVDEIKGCKECAFKYLCGGGCRATAYKLTKDWLGRQSQTICKWRKKYFAEMLALLQQRANLRPTV